MNIWSQINNEFQEENIIFIDAWLTSDDNENGNVIAKVDIVTGEVEYLDERAKTDPYAKGVIQDTLSNNLN